MKKQMKRKKRKSPIIRDLLARDQCDVLRDAVIAICGEVETLKDKIAKLEKRIANAKNAIATNGN